MIDGRWNKEGSGFSVSYPTKMSDHIGSDVSINVKLVKIYHR